MCWALESGCAKRKHCPVGGCGSLSAKCVQSCKYGRLVADNAMYPRLVIIVCAFIALVVGPFTSVTAQIRQLPYCNPAKENTRQSLLFVSTLDGQVSALDLLTGELKWTLELDKRPLLSSNIHSRELNNNGQWVRLIPSLKGDLYKFDGERVEPLPVTAEQLLKSSVRYSDNLVFSGGEETHSYRISSSTGQIISKCTLNGCTNITDSELYLDEDLVVVQRYQSTVRASDPRSGIERWNFSVGQHKLSIIPSPGSDCSSKGPNLSDIDIKFDLPTGLISTINKSNPLVYLWKYKFSSPIASIWKESEDMFTSEKGELHEVNLFDNSRRKFDIGSNPALYVAMHEKQLYIQQNPKFTGQNMFPWKPYPAIDFEESHQMNNNKELALVSSETQTTAISVLYNSEYINGNGFYLYSDDQLHFSENNLCNKTVLEGINFTQEQLLQEEETPVQIIIVSIWYYWKEIILISITTAIILNCMIDSKINFLRRKAKETVLEIPVADGHLEVRNLEERKISINEDDNNFSSRFLSDFDPIIRLGKGGFGIVFEAKNKIDECHYAIKRITLPNSQDSRERVMREVKALAKLDHQNIVRYFNSWVECPPIGWQEEQDEILRKNGVIPTKSEFTQGLSPTQTETHTKPTSSINNDCKLSLSSAIEAEELSNDDHANCHSDKNNDINHFHKSNSNDDEEDNDDDDDFIQFKYSEDDDETADSQSRKSTENSHISDSDSDDVAYEENSDENSDSIVFEEEKKKKNSQEDAKTSVGNSIIEEKPKVRQKAPRMYLYIQMQLCQRKSLSDWLKHCETPRDSARALNIFQQIVDAVEYVHLKGLIHRDLKPSNIFFAFDDKIKIGDFGLVTAMPDSIPSEHLDGMKVDSKENKEVLRTAEVGTHLYMSPEQMNGQMYNYKVDIYSLGIILFELLTPFSTDMERIKSLTNLRRSLFPDNFAIEYPAEYNLLKLMLENDPNKRPTTLGIKARPPLCYGKSLNKTNSVNSEVQWHFELPAISRHSSSSNTESNNSSEIGTSSSVEKSYPGGRNLFRLKLSKENFRDRTSDMILASLKLNSRKQDEVVWKKWWYFYDGASYGSLYLAKSANAVLVGSDTAKNREIKRFLKVSLNLTLSTSKNDTTWDPNLVLHYLLILPDNRDCDFKTLFLKLVSLLQLVIVHRIQTLALIIKMIL